MFLNRQSELRVGGWWQANEGIDVAVLSEDIALLVECKWTSRPVRLDILRDLERKASMVSGELGDRQRILGLCARSSFTQQVETEAVHRQDVLLFDLDRVVHDGFG